jgi:intracellular sulfur oxidation DsrE/DsrF family protein
LAVLVARRLPVRYAFLWISLPIVVALTAAGAGGQRPSDNTGLVYPLIPGHGGVVSLPRAAEQPRKGVKAVFDITADAKSGEMNKGLEHVARLLNLYGAAGLTARDVQVAAVLHGEADKAVLSDAAYAARFKVATNPNLPLIRDLKKAGVEVFVCGQSLHELGFKVEEVAKEVPVANSAMLMLVNKQTDGYGYIPAR